MRVAYSTMRVLRALGSRRSTLVRLVAPTVAVVLVAGVFAVPVSATSYCNPRPAEVIDVLANSTYAEFDGIPLTGTLNGQTCYYQDLRITGLAKSTGSASNINLYFQFGTTSIDTNADYYWTYAWMDGNGLSQAHSNGDTSITAASVPGSGSGTYDGASFSCVIPNYQGYFDKVMTCSNGLGWSTGISSYVPRLEFSSGKWTEPNVGPVVQMIRISSAAGTNGIAADSQFAYYLE